MKLTSMISRRFRMVPVVSILLAGTPGFNAAAAQQVETDPSQSAAQH